jgi:hypothetical protein
MIVTLCTDWSENHVIYDWVPSGPLHVKFTSLPLKLVGNTVLKLKLKFRKTLEVSLSLIMYYAMITYGEMGVQFHLFLISVID